MLVYLLLGPALVLLRGGYPGYWAQLLSPAWQMFLLYCAFSVFGWMLVGIPAVLALPPKVIVNWPWVVLICVGAAFGALALLLILLILGAGRLRLEHTGSLWPFAILVSTVSFVVYTALLLRRRTPS